MVTKLQLDRQIKQRASELEGAFQEQDPYAAQAALTSIVQLVGESVEKQISLKLDLEALDPPSHLESTHESAVATWGRLITLGRALRDDLATAYNPDQQYQILRVHFQEQGPEEERLAEHANLQLRQLAGSGCRPAF